MTNGIRALLRRLGKGESRVAVVFGVDAETCHRAVLHLRLGAPDVPIRLLSTTHARAETAALCETVYVDPRATALIGSAARLCWSRWVAIAVAPWTGSPGNWLLKAAPFCIPPFRALILNESGDFFPGSLECIRRHAWARLARCLGEWARSGEDVAAACRLWINLTVIRLVVGLRSFTRRGRISLPNREAAESLALPAAVPANCDAVLFEHNGPFWDAAALVKAVSASEAGLVYWHDTANAPAAYEDLLRFFEDPRTFAVSRQMHVRGWKPVPLPTAPYRALQAGEASQVMAPLSQFILVDRRKLMALGVPGTSLSAAAWMILFWRAAAAGWRSFSVGPCPIGAEQPDMPMDETALWLQTLRSRTFRRLAPREPHLSRGNIAFAALPGRAESRENRIRVLVVSPFLPYPLSHGGAVRIWNLCRALMPRVDFVLAAFREHGETVDYDRLHEVFREVYIVDRDERPADTALPAQVREYENRGMRALVAQVARKWQPDVLQIEYTHLAEFRDAAPEIPAILVEHDLTYQLYRQLARAEDADLRTQTEYRRWLEFEACWLAAFEGVWTVSAEDARAAVSHGKRQPHRTFVVPNGVDVRRFPPMAERSEELEILYVGSFRHLPNILGFQKLRDEVLPRLWERRPDVKCRVVAGLQHNEFWSRFSTDGRPAEFDSRVHVEGFVEDLHPLYAKASVVVVPLEVSAGTNIKVLEAMACGRAIVSTPRGCNGLDLKWGQEAFIESEWAAFSERILELLGDAALRSQMGRNARRTAEARFDWTHIADEAYTSYLVLKDGEAVSFKRVFATP